MASLPGTGAHFFLALAHASRNRDDAKQVHCHGSLRMLEHAWLSLKLMTKTLPWRELAISIELPDPKQL